MQLDIMTVFTSYPFKNFYFYHFTSPTQLDIDKETFKYRVKAILDFFQALFIS